MENVFIILWVIIVVAFIIGVVLFIVEKKKKSSEVLTDDVSILFEENLNDFYSDSFITDDFVFGDRDAMYKADKFLLSDVNVHENDSIADKQFDEEII